MKEDISFSTQVMPSPKFLKGVFRIEEILISNFIDPELVVSTGTRRYASRSWGMVAVLHSEQHTFQENFYSNDRPKEKRTLNLDVIR